MRNELLNQMQILFIRACVRPKCSSDHRADAEAAIALIRAEVLEEAASMIETRWQHGVGDHYAAAIRALKEKL